MSSFSRLNVKPRRVKITLVVETNIPLHALRNKGSWATQLLAIGWNLGSMRLAGKPKAEDTRKVRR